ncbi:hypothetical protein RUM43_003649 [Polyplax serrata]|uniref:Succinate-semialdehyde dehydrogenase n=1 Tax=Polyplax serrata TaxID=468196 RepID=A0AAN8S6K3_POLSC
MNSRGLSLLRQKAYIGGKWTDGSKNEKFDVTNPATGKIIGSAPNLNVQDVTNAIDSAKEAFQTWKHTTPKVRSNLLREWFNLVTKNSKDLAEIVTAEAGKCLAESLGEVNYGNSFLEWFSEEARRIHGEVIAGQDKTKEMIFIKEPIGVVGLITPWNFPVAMITRKAGAALAAGCTCVIKPAEDTPFSALALAELAEKAGFPPGVINVVTCNRKGAPEIGKLLCTHDSVAGISFTGSTFVGKLLYAQCAQGVKRVAFELGGNAPFLVFNSAKIDAAVNGAMASKFRNCGQTCVSANRFLIQEDVVDEFVSKLSARLDNVVCGNGTKSGVTMGPLINKAQIDKVSSLVDDAVSKGANVIKGGKRLVDLGELFYAPTILTNVKSNMNCYNEEIFGPVVQIIPFKTEEEGVKLANSTKSGLAGYFYSSDISQIWRVSKQLEVGMVGINEGIISCAEAAFGGVKESGIGREGSHHGIDEFVNVKYLCFGGLQ